MNHNTQQLISPQDPEWRKIYNNCRSRQGHFTQKVPERQTRITLSAKQNKNLRGFIEHNVQDNVQHNVKEIMGLRLVILPSRTYAPMTVDHFKGLSQVG